MTLLRSACDALVARADALAARMATIKERMIGGFARRNYACTGARIFAQQFCMEGYSLRFRL
jgi:hypothetical protein